MKYRDLLKVVETMQSYNAKLGLLFFTVYTLFYSAFVFLNVFAPQMMEQTPIQGVNLAILLGIGLIVLALVMALLYGFLCRREEAAGSSEEGHK
ncbi:MAG: DUF485 domain-containing protein [Pirellulaceae bacterium]|nr:DUF485 domain-containing protein [Pirellulaceae bacterium]